jgi:sigma-E factor negative regulatory protein RseB
MQRPTGDKSVEHMLLSDGFSSVSIYIEPLKGEFKEHPRKIGAINARTVKIDGFSITVMGEVPEKTIEAIAKGLKHQGRRSP